MKRWSDVGAEDSEPRYAFIDAIEDYLKEGKIPDKIQWYLYSSHKSLQAATSALDLALSKFFEECEKSPHSAVVKALSPHVE